MTFLFILLRVAAGSGLLLGLAGVVSSRIPASYRRTGFILAAGGIATLVALRIILRLTMPEAVPSFSG